MNGTVRIDHSPTILGAVLSAVSAVTLAACGASNAAAPSPTPSSVPVADVTAAKQAALRLFTADPSVAGHWDPCSNSDNWAACPLSASVKARLADLISKGYFGDRGGC